MPLDVWIGLPTKNDGSGLVLSFDPEAYYWFLYPLFEEFVHSHGQMIDLYDGAMFAPEELKPVLDLVDRAVTQVAAQSDEFEVRTGTNLGSALKPRNKEIYHTVVRTEYLAFLEQLRSAALETQRLGKPLVFFGD